ncbi:HNH endonuclease [Halocatena pleomorpha]|uniref:HNH endonuclease n=1 Tax=Halocatena pleomorpha TaxID=1785090 RepID=A0A3P3RL22_9EURY|nr:HNH endonuclease [Halocatena pleomorpha]
MPVPVHWCHPRRETGEQYRPSIICIRNNNKNLPSWRTGDYLPSDDELRTSTYETTVHARAVDPEFRATVLARYDQTCPLSGVDQPGLLDVAHVLSWRDYPEHRADLANVLALSKTHHAAFDRGLFTIDRNYRLCVNPSFETESDLLQRTIIERAGERVELPATYLNSEYMAQHNAALEWV